MDKKEIRKIILSIRRELNDEYVVRASSVICDKLREHDYYKACDKICLYISINNEVCLDSILDECEDKKLYLPRVEDKRMEFYLYKGRDKLKKGTYDILEPIGDDKLVPDDNTLIVMPGVAFSEDGARIGYGGGYYDTYLARYPMCRKVAVAFTEQIVPYIPEEAHDLRPDIIIHN